MSHTTHPYYDLAVRAAQELTTEDKGRLVAYLLGGEDFEAVEVAQMTIDANEAVGNLPIVFSDESLLAHAEFEAERVLTGAENADVIRTFQWGSIREDMTTLGNDYIREHVGEALALAHANDEAL